MRCRTLSGVERFNAQIDVRRWQLTAVSAISSRPIISEQPKRRRCGVSDHVSRRTAAILVTVGVVHVFPQRRRADTDVLDVHVDFYVRDAHTCASCAQGKAKPPGISAVPRADIQVAADVHYPNRRPRPKCSVRTAHGDFEFAGSVYPSELLRCPAHDSGAYTSSPSLLANPYFASREVEAELDHVAATEQCNDSSSMPQARVAVTPSRGRPTRWR